MKDAGSKTYLRTKVLTANPAELRLMLFDGAVRFAEHAHVGLQQKNYEACYVGITRCQSILMELINGLRPEHDPDLCKKLSALYTYMYTQLMKASSTRDAAIIEEVIKLLQYERQTWQLLLDQLAQENMAANTLQSTPDAAPPSGQNGFSAVQGLIGGVVSVQG